MAENEFTYMAVVVVVDLSLLYTHACFVEIKYIFYLWIFTFET